jgi:hypothetical protein
VCLVLISLSSLLAIHPHYLSALLSVNTFFNKSLLFLFTIELQLHAWLYELAAESGCTIRLQDISPRQRNKRGPRVKANCQAGDYQAGNCQAAIYQAGNCQAAIYQAGEPPDRPQDRPGGGGQLSKLRSSYCIYPTPSKKIYSCESLNTLGAYA